jgi:hypothetical protein
MKRHPGGFAGLAARTLPASPEEALAGASAIGTTVEEQRRPKTVSAD